MNKYQFFIEMLDRFKSSRPAFFARVQMYAAILFMIGGAVETLPLFGVEIPDKFSLGVGLVMAFLSGTGLVAQLPNKDQNQK